MNLFIEKTDAVEYYLIFKSFTQTSPSENTRLQ